MTALTIVDNRTSKRLAHLVQSRPPKDKDSQPNYHPYHATRADLLRRLGRRQEARAAYDRAITLTGNTAAAAYLIRRRDQLGEP